MKSFSGIFFPVSFYHSAAIRLAVGIFLLLFWLPVALFSQPKLDLDHLTLRMFNAPEDLPNEVVRDVIMTHDDSVWIATWGGGIVVMKGTERRLFDKQNGLISDDVRVLEEDGAGRVWVGTSAGISCIQDQRIRNFSVQTNLAIPVSDSIFSIEAIDNGEVWFGDGIGNLFAWSPPEKSSSVEDGHWKSLYNFWDSIVIKDLKECSIRKIVQGRDRSVWLAVNNAGAIKIDSPEKNTITLVNDSRINGFCFDVYLVDSNRLFWLEYRKFNEIERLKGVNSRFAPANCKCMEYAFGTMFLGTEQGLYYLADQDQNSLPLTWNDQKSRLYQYQFHPFPLSKNNRLYCIESLSSLRDGSLWVGTRNGAFRITQTSWIPQTFALKSTALFHENYDPAYKQNALALDEKGNLWSYRDHAWKTIHQLDPAFVYANPDLKFVPTNTLYARANHLLIQFVPGLVEFDLSQMRIVNQFHNDPVFNGKYQIFLTDNQEIWYTGPKGVLRQKGNETEPVFDLPAELNPEVLSILQTGPDQYWIGGKGWLGRYDQGRFEPVDLPPQFQKDNAAILCSLQTQDGELWFSQQGQGLLRYKDGQWRRENIGTGLTSNYIVSLMQSHDGTIWAGDRSNGVLSYKDGRWIHYTDEDGILIGNVSILAEDEDGNPWIGIENLDLYSSQNYVNIFQFQPDHNPPAVQILSASSRLLPDVPGMFSFQGYDAWNETPRDQLVYSWRVLHEKNGRIIHDWQPYTSLNSVVIPTLPPGNYRFEVRAQDRFRNTGVSSTAALVVEPYFWMSRMFQIPMVSALFFAALSLYLNRKRYKQKMENRLLQEKMNFMEFCEISKIGMLRLTPEGKIHSMNQAMAGICGFEHERQMREHPAPLQWKHPEQFQDFFHSLSGIGSYRHTQMIGIQPRTGKEFFVFLYGKNKDSLLEIMALDLTPQMAVEELVLQAQVQQQQKIGQDLHDSVVQDLTGILHHVQCLIEKNKFSTQIDIQDIEFLDQIVEHSCLKLRQMSLGRSPIDFQEIDFGTALQEIRYDLQRAYPAPVYEFQIPAEFPWMDLTVQDHLYNIVHEALFNAAKHARASRISLVCERLPNQILFTIRDNGIGMERKGKIVGLGLANMRRRADLIGAELSIAQAPEGGTVIECRYSFSLKTFET